MLRLPYITAENHNRPLSNTVLAQGYVPHESVVRAFALYGGYTLRAKSPLYSENLLGWIHRPVGNRRGHRGAGVT